MSCFLFFLSAYLIGSVPTAYIVGRLVKGVDIRKHGSGNVGATNVFRVVGKKWGIFVLVLDILKGVFPVLLAGIFYNRYFSDGIDVVYLKLLAGFFAVCGHNWPIFLKFKGGKGVAATAGIVLAVFPKAFFPVLFIFFTVVFVFRYVSLASIISTLFFPLFLYIFYKNLDSFPVLFFFSLILAIFIVYRHRENIKRLIKGEERKIV